MTYAEHEKLTARGIPLLEALENIQARKSYQTKRVGGSEQQTKLRTKLGRHENKTYKSRQGPSAVNPCRHSNVSVSKLKQVGFGEMEAEWGGDDGNGNELWPVLAATESELENIWAKLESRGGN